MKEISPRVSGTGQNGEEESPSSANHFCRFENIVRPLQERESLRLLKPAPAPASPPGSASGVCIRVCIRSFLPRAIQVFIYLHFKILRLSRN